MSHCLLKLTPCPGKCALKLSEIHVVFVNCHHFWPRQQSKGNHSKFSEMPGHCNCFLVSHQCQWDCGSGLFLETSAAVLSESLKSHLSSGRKVVVSFVLSVVVTCHQLLSLVINSHQLLVIVGCCCQLLFVVVHCCCLLLSIVATFCQLL